MRRRHALRVKASVRRAVWRPARVGSSGAHRYRVYAEKVVKAQAKNLAKQAQEIHFRKPAARASLCPPQGGMSSFCLRAFDLPARGASLCCSSRTGLSEPARQSPNARCE